MEILLLIGVGILLLLAIIGSFNPVVPGPLLSYIALLLFHLFINKVNEIFLIWIGIVVAIISILDYVFQIYGVKVAGGGRHFVISSFWDFDRCFYRSLYWCKN